MAGDPPRRATVPRLKVIAHTTPRRLTVVGRPTTALLPLRIRRVAKIIRRRDRILRHGRISRPSARALRLRARSQRRIPPAAEVRTSRAEAIQDSPADIQAVGTRAAEAAGIIASRPDTLLPSAVHFLPSDGWQPRKPAPHQTN